MSSNENVKRQNQALADALAGVAGTLVSLWAFYPIELIKTNLQASIGQEKGLLSVYNNLFSILFDSEFYEKKNCCCCDVRETTNTIVDKTKADCLQRIDRGSIDDNKSETNTCIHGQKKRKVWKYLLILFRGLSTKTVQAASSSFCYFFLHSWIVSTYQRLKKRPLNNHNYRQQIQNNDVPMHPTTRLILSAMAAMLNTFLTLPLDVLSSRHAVQRQLQQGSISQPLLSLGTAERNEDLERSNSSDAEKRPWNNLIQNPETAVNSNSSSRDSLLFSSLDDFNDDEYDCLASSTSIQADAMSVAINNQQKEHNETRQKEHYEMSSPTDSNFEVIDVDKVDGHHYAFLWKGLCPALLLCSNPSIHYTVYEVLKSRVLILNSKSRQRLTMSEAFIFGLIAKFIATITTYPLIRAKVILMVTSETSTWNSLVHSYMTEGGVSGLYKGCDWQLLHTILKTALMMAVRERISAWTHQ